MVNETCPFCNRSPFTMKQIGDLFFTVCCNKWLKEDEDDFEFDVSDELREKLLRDGYIIVHHEQNKTNH